MRKFIIIIIAVLMLTGCIRQRLYIYNWEQYIPQSILAQFEREFNVRIIYDEFHSSEELYANVISQRRPKWDIIFPCIDYAFIFMSRNMLEPLNHALIPNLRNIDPAIPALIAYDLSMSYIVPFYMGATGIAVNTTKVSEFERTWNIFSRTDIPGRMAMLDDMREVIGAALNYLGYCINTTYLNEINTAKNFIIENWKPNIVFEDQSQQFANGEVWIIQTFAENVYQLIKDDEEMMANTLFFIPDNSFSYIDVMGILRTSRNKELAHQFINFIHRPTVYAQLCDAFNFPSVVNVPARELRTEQSWYEKEDVQRTITTYIGVSFEYYIDAWYNYIRVNERNKTLERMIFNIRF